MCDSRTSSFFYLPVLPNQLFPRSCRRICALICALVLVFRLFFTICTSCIFLTNWLIFCYLFGVVLPEPHYVNVSTDLTSSYADRNIPVPFDFFVPARIEFIFSVQFDGKPFGVVTFTHTCMSNFQPTFSPVMRKPCPIIMQKYGSK